MGVGFLVWITGKRGILYKRQIAKYTHQDDSPGDKLELPRLGMWVRTPRRHTLVTPRVTSLGMTRNRGYDRPLEGCGILAGTETPAYTPYSIDPWHYDIDWKTH